MSRPEAKPQRRVNLVELWCELGSDLSLRSLLPKVADAALDLMVGDLAAVLLLDDSGSHLIPAAVAGVVDEAPAFTIPLKDTVAAQALSEGALLISDAATSSRTNCLSELAPEFKPASLLVAPLESCDAQLGTLIVARSSTGGDLESELDFFDLFAQQASVAIRNARRFEGLEEAREIADGLRLAGIALSSTLEYDEVLARILEQISQLIPQAAVNIMFLEDGEARVYRGSGYEQFGTQEVVSTISLKVADVPIFTEMERTGEPLIIPDVDKYEGWVYARPEHHWIKSYAAAPILSRGKTIGFLNVNSAIPGFFGQSHVEYLQAFASQAGIAFENARLYDQAQEEISERRRAESELRRHQDHLEELIEERTAEVQRRNRELTALNAAAQALSSSLNLHEIMEQVLECLLDSLGFAAGLIVLADRKTGDLNQTYSMNLSQALLEDFKAKDLSDTLCGQVYRERTPRYLTEYDEALCPGSDEWKASGFQACVSAPVTYQDRALGVFCLFDSSADPVLAAEDSLLIAMGRQMGVAVENVSLFWDIVRERQASQILLDTAQALSTTLRIDTLLERVLDELQRVVPYDAASISMLRNDRCWAIAARGEGYVPARPFDLEERPLVKRVVDQKAPVILPQVSADADWSSAGVEEVRSWLGVPLISKDEVIGVLAMDSNQPHTYGESPARLALSFAHQTALAIENSRLYEHAHARLRETSLLHSVTMVLAATLELDRILPYVARSLCEILNATSVMIYGIDDQEGELPESAVVISSYLSQEPTEGGQGRYAGNIYSLRDLPPTLDVLAQRNPLQARVDDPEIDQSVQDMLEAWDAQAVLIMPMAAGDRLLGFAQVWEAQAPRHFTNSEISTGQTLVNQAGTAVYNARLVEALRQHTLDLEAQNAELDAFAHTVAHDLKTPLTSLIGFSSLLEERLESMAPERVRENLGIIGRNGRRMINIIDELLLLASVRKVEEVDVREIDMSVIVKEVESRLSDVLKESEAHLILPNDWPAALGHGPWIEEVLTNYVSNAVKYGGRPPRVELGGALQEDGMVCFWVQDNGMGLSPEDQERLFTPFTRLHNARAEGHGLGLSIVQRIAEKLGGEVGVESSGVPGQGSRFYFTLPAAE